jgi:hypothetical protein
MRISGSYEPSPNTEHPLTSTSDSADCRAPSHSILLPEQRLSLGVFQVRNFKEATDLVGATSARFQLARAATQDLPHMTLGFHYFSAPLLIRETEKTSKEIFIYIFH